MAGQQKCRRKVTNSEVRPVLGREKSEKMGLLRVLKRKVNKEQRKRLGGKKKEIWDNVSPSLLLNFEKLVVVFPSNTNTSFLNAVT